MQTVKLICTYNICAAHKLSRDDWDEEKNKKVFGRCSSVHGHQYRIDIELVGGIDSETGMLINGYDVDDIVKRFLEEKVDHKFFNDDIAFFKTHQPTAEWISVWLFEELKALFPAHVDLSKVRVYETPELAVEYGK
ncbi:MAG: 6-carboxytetrahydropterin synthase [bacterium]